MENILRKNVQNMVYDHTYIHMCAKNLSHTLEDNPNDFLSYILH